jgi:hypothetical protein
VRDKASLLYTTTGKITATEFWFSLHNCEFGIYGFTHLSPLPAMHYHKIFFEKISVVHFPQVPAAFWKREKVNCYNL